MSSREDIAALPEHFLRFVDRSGGIDACWLWTGRRYHDGYGRFSLHHKWVRAHRYAWEAMNGPIPQDHHICHHCDTPLCVNPAHLFAGTRSDNMQDALRKGRFARGDAHWLHQHPELHGLHLHPEKAPRGERNGMRRHPERSSHARLNWEMVAAMRADYQIGKMSHKQLAAKYGVSKSTVGYVVTGRTWRTTGREVS